MATSANVSGVDNNIEDVSNFLEDKVISKPQEKLPSLPVDAYFKVCATLLGNLMLVFCHLEPTKSE